MNQSPSNEPIDQGVSRRDFLVGSVAAGVVAGGSLGAFYFGYETAVGSPLRVGVIGTGDEGSVLLGAINPEFIEVKSIADIRPYSLWRAFYGDHSSEAALAARPGLMAKYHWKTEDEARRHVKVYDYKSGGYEELLAKSKADGLEGVIIALPLHLHDKAAILAMQHGLHVITEKLMGHSVGQCKDMARTAAATGMILATGHQRHYNILYANAVDSIKRGVLGDLHYIRAQWNRGNLPEAKKDSWAQPMPKAVRPGDPQAKVLGDRLVECREKLDKATGAAVDLWRKRLEQVEAQIADDVLEKEKYAEKYGYQSGRYTDGKGVPFTRTATEELIRWRLFDRTGAGLMAELGSHQLDAASIFIAAMHKGEKQMPLSVCAAGDRPLFPADRDIEDHVYCILEFPAPGYDPKGKLASKKRIGVQYASINGNGFGGYGEMVFGTKGTLVLDSEAELSILASGGPSSIKVSSGSGGPTLDTQASGAAPTSITVSGGGGGGPTLDTQASGPAKKSKISRGYAEELEHWAWCIRNPAPENQPRCSPKIALGDAVIALTTNIAARKGERIDFKKEWFDINSDETPEGTPPSVPASSKKSASTTV